MAAKTDLNHKLQQLRQFHRETRRLPSYREMLSLFGYRSKNAVYGVVNKLEEAGYLRRDDAGKITLTERLTRSIKLLGRVEAGFPSPAEEELVDLMSLDEYLVRRPEATYMLTVNGDSMMDAGIHPGDLVLVERGGAAPRSGDIVIAQVDGEWTLKYFRKQGRSVRLEPANKKYEAIEPKQSLVIGGIVKAVVRKYR